LLLMQDNLNNIKSPVNKGTYQFYNVIPFNQKDLIVTYNDKPINSSPYKFSGFYFGLAVGFNLDLNYLRIIK
jgi:hypothetical protein